MPILAPNSTPAERLRHELWIERNDAKGGIREIKPIRELIKLLKETMDSSEREEEQAIAKDERARLAVVVRNLISLSRNASLI